MQTCPMKCNIETFIHCSFFCFFHKLKQIVLHFISELSRLGERRLVKILARTCEVKKEGGKGNQLVRVRNN